jgi:hypothetical protein
MDPRERINEPEEAQRAALDGRQARIRTAMPGIVTAVDLAKQTLSVQPAIQGQQDFPDGTTESVSLPMLVDVPIVWPRAGGFALTFPIKVGDEVLVVFGDRCIDSWWQSGGQGAPLEPRMHDLSDAFAILAPASQPKAQELPNVSSTSVQLRNLAGTAYVEITEDADINIVSPRDVKVTAGRDFILNASARNMQNSLGVTTLTSAGLMTLTSAAGLNFGASGGSSVTMTTGPVTWNAANFNLTSAAGIGLFSVAALAHNGKNVGSTHTHGGVTTGGGSTAVPN